MAIDLYDFRYSYSSVSSFENCKLMWKYNYIDKEWGVDNFFAEVGTAVHETIQKYFEYQIDELDMPQFYKKAFEEIVVDPCPPYPAGMADNYFNFSLNFFENFDLDREDYEILMLEDKIETEYEGIKLVVKPDLVLKHKQTGRVILIDHKTSNIYKGKKLDESKMEGYRKQLVLYATFIEKIKNIKVDKILIWAIRDQKFERIEYNEEIANKTLEWFKSTVEKIRNETEWKDGGSKYFCQNICSFRNICGYKK